MDNLNICNTMRYISHRQHEVNVYGRQGDTINVTITINIEKEFDFNHDHKFTFQHTLKSEWVKMLSVEYDLVTHFDSDGNLLYPLHVTLENFQMIGEIL